MTTSTLDTIARRPRLKIGARPERGGLERLAGLGSACITAYGIIANSLLRDGKYAMCGRYALNTSTPALAAMLGMDLSGTNISWSAATAHAIPDMATGELIDINSFNIAPTQQVLVCRTVAGPCDSPWSLQWMRWGLVPSWSKDDKAGAKMINARAETVRERPAYRQAMRQRRCLIPASGFYEWKRTGKLKQPYFFGSADHGPIAFAGLWETWHNPNGDVIASCTVITTEANAVVAPIHARMPVVLARDNFAKWLAPGELPQTQAQTLLQPAPAQTLVAFPVSTLVNNARNNEPRCLEPLGEPLGQTAGGSAQESHNAPVGDLFSDQGEELMMGRLGSPGGNRSDQSATSTSADIAQETDVAATPKPSTMDD
ncbi:MAG: putative SOS response-associated peptidase YedK [Gammaproteobacteria bacterium]